LLSILGPALAYPIAGVDPLLLNLNLAQVSHGLAIPAGSQGLLAGASTLVVAATVLAVGNLGDRFGLRRILVLGLSANVIVGIGSSLVPSYPLLLTMRFLDGLTLAALLGVSLALVAASVPAELRSRAIGIVMAIYTLMYGLTPLIGGWVVGAFGWRALFVVTAPFAVLALVLTKRFGTDPPCHPSAKLDALGVTLFGLALLGLVAGIGAAPSGVSNPRCWLPLVVSGVAVGLLLRHETRTNRPALDLRLFAHRAFLIAVTATVAINMFAASLGTVVGQLSSYVLGLSAQQIGLLYLPGTILVAAASVWAGHAVAHRTARPVLVLGLFVVTLSGVVLAVTASPAMGIAALVLATWLSNLGGFITGTAAADTILGQAPEGRTGSVAAIQPAFAMTGYALGPTVVIFLLDAFFRQQWLTDASGRGLSQTTAQQAVTAVTTAVSSSPGATGYDPSLYSMAAGLTLGIDYTTGARLAILVMAAAPLCVAILAYFWMPRRASGQR
jgi:MFS family permease